RAPPTPADGPPPPPSPASPSTPSGSSTCPRRAPRPPTPAALSCCASRSPVTVSGRRRRPPPGSAPGPGPPRASQEPTVTDEQRADSGAPLIGATLQELADLTGAELALADEVPDLRVRDVHH